MVDKKLIYEDNFLALEVSAVSMGISYPHATGITFEFIPRL